MMLEPIKIEFGGPVTKHPNQYRATKRVTALKIFIEILKMINKMFSFQYFYDFGCRSKPIKPLLY